MTQKKARKPAVKNPVVTIIKPDPPEAITEPVTPVTQPVGRPRREATVQDLIIQLKEARITALQIIKQNPRRKYRLSGITRQIGHWVDIVLKKIDDAPGED